MKVFVTGSTGLLGNNLVRQLLEQGHQVKALVRSLSKAKLLFDDLPIEYIKGDMDNIAGFEPALAGCQALFHTAAYFREYYGNGDHWKTLEQINITGALELFKAAQRQGVERIIHTSSSGVIDDAVGDETSGPNPHAERNLYFKSKVVSDQKIKELIAETGAPIITILPGWMLGPGDLAPTASGQLVLDFVMGKLPGWFDGGSSTVDARDVAAAMITAVSKGKLGERYIVGGEFVPMKTLVETLAKVSGLPGPKRAIPTGLLLLVAGGSELWGRITGKPGLLSREGVQTMLDKHQVKSNKAIRELGAHFRPLAETLADELSWYSSAGKIPAHIKLPQSLTAHTVSSH